MLTLIIFDVFLPIIFSSASLTNSAPYTPTDYILLNCGASSNTTSDDGRNWIGDADFKYSSSSSNTSSFASIASYQELSVTEVPYMTARIFDGKFTYKFPISPGPKFLRLYFYPNQYPGLDITTSFFSVTANSYTLMNNFSAINPTQAFIIKEFVIPVINNQMLNVTFTPSPKSFAFVNGIEVVSMPNDLYIGKRYGSPRLLGSNYFFELDNTTALETAYRLNVGGTEVSNIDDTGMFRTWGGDRNYIFGAGLGVTPFQPKATIKYTQATPAYTAAEVVYKTSRPMGPTASINLNYNLTWLLPVDSGFYYLVRLHFCETVPDVTLVNERVFNIFINNQTAEASMDVIAISGGNGIPVYRDYVVRVPQSPITQELWVALHPCTKSHPLYWDAILNGLEIFKLSKSDGSLAAPNHQAELARTSPILEKKQSKKSRKSLILIKVIIAATLSSIVSIFLLFSFISWQRKHFLCRTKSSKKRKVSPFSEGIRCKHFSLSEILTATNNFDDGHIIGRGGFGNVYRGRIQGIQYEVAMKRLNSQSHQGENEFWAEIEMLSQLRYINLVSLIGYCNDTNEMILVYDYMANGTLRDHLYNNDNIPLQWKQRLQICIGAARGLDYLHSGAVQRIIHRDVKTTNILLDEKWVAKLSDFGLSKMGPIFMANIPITTMVKGTFGYMDPEYYRRLQLTEKSDVYSFGVVLFEVLCARPAVDINLEDDQIGLAGWALKCVENETIEQIIDPYLQGKIAAECLSVFVEISKNCLHEVGVERPKMSDVVGMLEFALQLQETAEAKQTIEVGDTIQSQTIDEVV